MCLPARVGLGILPLPLGTLAFELGLPFTGLRIEAVWSDVVAGIVERGCHAVEVRIKLIRDLAIARLIRLFEAEGDPAALEVDIDDLDKDFIADLHDLLGDLDMTLCKLGNVDQSLDTFLHADEGTNLVTRPGVTCPI